MRVQRCKRIKELEFVGLVLLSNLLIFPSPKSNDYLGQFERKFGQNSQLLLRQCERNFGQNSQRGFVAIKVLPTRLWSPPREQAEESAIEIL